MDSWTPIDKGEELRTYRLKIDRAEIQSIDWLKTFLEKGKLQLIPGRLWRESNISVWTLNLPSDLIEELSKKVNLEKAEYFVWINHITLSFNGTDKLYLDVKTPNVWISADLLTIGDLSSFENWYTGGVFIDTATTTGGAMGATTGNMFTTGKKIIDVKTEGDLLLELRKQKDKLWGMVLYAHGNSKGGISSVSHPERIRLNQRLLISELQKYGYKLSKIYMMQCYSGYQGEIAIVEREISNPTISPKVKKITENYYENYYRKILNSSYEKVTSAKVVPQENKPGYKLIVKTQVNWAAGWENVGIYTYTYTGMNFALIDLGILDSD